MVTKSMYSSQWYRLCDLKPELSPHVVLARQVQRGQTWYVAYDKISNRAHRLSASAYGVVARLDGRTSLDDIWLAITDTAGDEAPSQDEIIDLLGKLYIADMLRSDEKIDMLELAAREDEARRKQMRQRVMNPLFIRVPVMDPDRLLSLALPFVRPMIGPAGFVAWALLMVWLIVQVFYSWDALTSGITDRVLATDNLILMAVIFPVLKLLHELGHGFAIKRYGGEVHEIGLMFLIFVPIPYVEASATVTFSNKWHRAFVGAAGMMVELVIAALALGIWLIAEPGFLRSVCFNTLLIAGVSTVLFNGNPLLRFDAYYILSDVIEIPNLAMRSTRYWTYLAQRWLFGLSQAQSPVSAPGERGWFLTYAPASLVYRLFVMLGIATFVATEYFFIGVILVIWTLWLSFGWPIFKSLRFLFFNPALTGHRPRALGTSALGVGLIAVILLVIPVPHGTVVKGMVWIPQDGLLVAQTEGFVQDVFVEDGTVHEAGAPAIRLDDPLLPAEVALRRASFSEMQLRLQAARAQGAFESQLMQRQLGYARRALDDVLKQSESLTVKTPSRGKVVIPQRADLPGQFVRRGSTLGYVLGDEQRRVLVLVPASQIETVRSRTHGVSVRLSSQPLAQIDGVRIVREVPSVSRRLPDPAFGQPAGGPFPLDPTAEEPLTSLTPFFEIELELPAEISDVQWKERVHVRFDHGAVPLAARLYRMIRQNFLSQFDV